MTESSARHVGASSFEPLLEPQHEPLTMVGLLDRRLAETPDAPALRVADGEYTFAEFDRATDRCANGLASLGVRQGDRVAIMMQNHSAFVLVWWGITKVGAIEVPVNVAYKGQLLSYIINHSAADVLVVDAAFLPEVAAVANELTQVRLLIVNGEGSTPADLDVEPVAFSTLLQASDDQHRTALQPSDPVAIMYTSGTTGPSKGVVLPHNYFVNMGTVNAHQRVVRTGDVLYTCLPLFHGNAQLLTVMTGVVSGAAVALGERFSVSGFWPDIRRFRATQFNYIGTILTLLLKGELGAESGHEVRLAWGAGAKGDVWKEFEARFGISVSEAYGMTEIGMVLYTPRDAPRPGSCGKPIAMADVIVADEHDEQVPPGVVGQLLTRPRRPLTMMLGYSRMPEQTLEAFRNLWFHTGDAAYTDTDGYFFFVDRVKDAIRRRGENISSFEVEQIANAHPDVVETAAIPVPSELGEDEVMICIVPRIAPDAFSVSGFLTFCSDQMPRFMVPRYVRLVESLPKTSTERVEKYKLRQEGVTLDTWDAEASRA